LGGWGTSVKASWLAKDFEGACVEVMIVKWKRRGQNGSETNKRFSETQLDGLSAEDTIRVRRA
jgi:hypothetical protein